MRLTVARPIPVPSNSAWECSRWNTPNSRPASSEAKPAPLSRTAMTGAAGPPPAAKTSMRAGSRPRVNFKAFESRLTSTTRSRLGSASSQGRPETRHSTARPRVSGASSSITSFTRGPGSTGCLATARLPNCENPNRAAISLPMRSTEPRMRANSSRAGALKPAPASSSSIWVKPLIWRRGARRSWETE